MAPARESDYCIYDIIVLAQCASTSKQRFNIVTSKSGDIVYNKIKMHHIWLLKVSV